VTSHGDRTLIKEQTEPRPDGWICRVRLEYLEKSIRRYSEEQLDVSGEQTTALSGSGGSRSTRPERFFEGQGGGPSGVPDLYNVPSVRGGCRGSGTVGRHGRVLSDRLQPRTGIEGIAQAPRAGN